MNNINYTKAISFFFIGITVLVGGLFSGIKDAEAAIPTLKISSWASMANYNASVEIYWSSTDATSCDIKRDGATVSTATTTKSFYIKNIVKETLITGTCSGSMGTSTVASVKIGVLPQVIVPTISLFRPATNTVEWNGATTLSWTVQNADTCDIVRSQVVLKSGLPIVQTGFSTGPINKYSTFELKCTKGTQTAVAMATVSPKMEVKISATPLSVPYGGTATVNYSAYWDAQYTCTVTDGTWISDVDNGKEIINDVGKRTSVVGSKTFTNLTANKTVTITCPIIDTFNPSNIDKAPQKKTVTITVAAAAPVNGACGTTVNTCLNNTKFVDKADTTTSKLWSCEGLNGGTTASCSQIIPVASSSVPTITMKAGGGATTYDYRSNVKLTWASTNASTCNIKKDGLAWQSGTSSSVVGGVSIGEMTKDIRFTASCVGPTGLTKDSILDIKVLSEAESAPKLISYSAAKQILEYGQPAILSWDIANAQSCTLRANNIDIKTGLATKMTNYNAGPVYGYKTFELKCINGTKVASIQTSVSAKIGVDIKADKLTVPYGGTATVSYWGKVETGQFKCTVTDGTWISETENGKTVYNDVGTKPFASGTKVFTNIIKDKTVSITCPAVDLFNTKYVDPSPSTKSVTIKVSATATPTTTATSTAPTFVSFVATKKVVEYNEATTLSWEAKNATSCALKKNNVIVKTGLPIKSTGFNTGPLNVYSNFELQCINGTKVASSFASITPRIGAEITAEPIIVQRGSSAAVSWSAKWYADFACLVTDGTWISEVDNGKKVYQSTKGIHSFTNIMNDKTVKMTCSFIDTLNPKNIDTNPVIKTITIKATGTPAVKINGLCGTAKNTCLNGTKFVDKTDTATSSLWSCEGLNGGTTASCSLPIVTVTATGTLPTVTLKADKTRIDYNDKLTLSWTSTNADSCEIKSNGVLKYTGLNNPGVTFPVAGSYSSYVAWCKNKYGEARSVVYLDIYNRPPYIPGECSVVKDTCLNKSVFVDKPDTVTEYLWDCNGTGGGANASCKIPITKGEPVFIMSSQFMEMDRGANPEIKWQSDKATSCTIKKDGVVWQTGISNTGVRTGPLIASTVISGSCIGAGGTSKEVVLNLKVRQTVINGVCGQLKDSCNSPTIFEDRVDTATDYLWMCKGLNGGMSDTCRLSKQLTTIVPSITITPTANPFNTKENLFVKWSSTNARSCSTDIDGKIDTRGLTRDEIFFGQRDKDISLKITCLGYGTQKTESILLKAIVPTRASVVCGTTLNACLAGTTFVDKTDSTINYLWNCKEQNSASTTECLIPKSTAGLPVVTLSTGKTSITNNESYKVKWSSYNAFNCDLKKNGVVYRTNLPANSEISLDKEASDVTLSMVCRGDKSVLSKESSVAIKVVPNTIVKFVSAKALNNIVPIGDSAILSWEFIGAASCSLSGDSNGYKESLPAKMDNYKTGPVNNYTDYTLTCRNSLGGGGAVTSISVSPKTFIDITTDKATVASGGSATVKYSMRAGRDTRYVCKVTDGTWVSDYENGKTLTNYVNGTKTFDKITANKTVTITCSYYDPFNDRIDTKDTISKSVVIKVGSVGLNPVKAKSAIASVAAAVRPTGKITLSSNLIVKGESVNVSWESSNSKTCKIMKGVDSIAEGTKGSVSSGALFESSVIWMLCEGDGGTFSSTELIQLK